MIFRYLNVVHDGRLNYNIFCVTDEFRKDFDTITESFLPGKPAKGLPMLSGGEHFKGICRKSQI